MKNNESKALSLELVEIDHHKFAIEVVSGTVRANLTQMAKPFGKNPKDWLKNEWTQRYLSRLSVRINLLTENTKSVSLIIDTLSVPTFIGTEELITKKQGGTPWAQGTWANHHNIIMAFAGWLDIDFAIEVNELIFKLLTKQATIAEPFNGVDPLIHLNKAWYYYKDVLRSIGFSLTSGSVRTRKKKNEKHFYKTLGRNFIDLEYCHRLKEEAVKYGIQLEIPFKETKQLEGGSI